MKNKVIAVILGIFLIAGIVATSGCTASTKEVLVGQYKATDNANGNALIVTLPNNTQSVRAEYVLVAPNNYGMGGNGNMGVTDQSLQQGEDPWMNGEITDSQYLEGKNKKLSGNFTFGSGKYFAYQGMFTGTIKVYANVTE